MQDVYTEILKLNIQNLCYLLLYVVFVKDEELISFSDKSNIRTCDQKPLCVSVIPL